MSARCIQPIREPLDAVVRLPGSKSLSNRAALVAGLSRGQSVLSNFLFAQDTERLLEGLRSLGIAVEVDLAERRVEITGCSGHLPASEAVIDCGESGTMLRFFTALCATATGEYRLYGSGRLHQRPMAPLVAALRRMGALLEFEEQEDHAPLVVHGRGLRGGHIALDSSLSSQFASAVLLAGPCATSDVMLEVTGAGVSLPYLRMTCGVMKSFGIDLVTEDYRKIVLPAPQTYESTNYAIEPDASSAGYFLAACAICGGALRIEGLGRDSIQGDLRLLGVLEEMGCTYELEDRAVRIHKRLGAQLAAVDVDLADMPDAAPTVAVLGLFSAGAVRIRNVAHLQLKESPRLTVLAAQLRRLGAGVDIHDDGLTVHPPERIEAAELDPCDDHRMAMALSLAGLAAEGISIRNPACVNKSFPDYFATLESLSRS